MKLTYEITDIAPYINWAYFYHAWGMSGKPDAEKQKLRQEADDALHQMEDCYHTYALFELFDASSDGDDVIIEGVRRIPFLRQQQPGRDCLCLSDFIRPTGGDRVGVFATSVDHGLEMDFEEDPYQKMMMQLLADRLAEATAERMHEEVRKHYWGYAKDENLSISEMQVEKFQGIRPAVGYPSLPDTSLNFVIDQLLDMKQIGIRLTESGAMKPHASVSGFMFAHPQAHYFSLGKIGEDQLIDYARRRGLPVETLRKFLASNL
jgi:cobalamin-dependent methionine synthase I